MRPVHLIWFVLATALVSVAQLTIENPKQLNFPEERARLLLRMSCRSVAAELHIRESSIPTDMHLVLGEKDERFGYESHTGVPTLYLQEWDDKKFVTATLKFAIERSIDRHRQEQMILDVLRHYEAAAPVSVARLRASPDAGSTGILKGKDNCLDAIGYASVRDVGCNSRQDRRTR